MNFFVVDIFLFFLDCVDLHLLVDLSIPDSLFLMRKFEFELVKFSVELQPIHFCVWVCTFRNQELQKGNERDCNQTFHVLLVQFLQFIRRNLLNEYVLSPISVWIAVPLCSIHIFLVFFEIGGKDNCIGHLVVAVISLVLPRVPQNCFSNAI